ncbi:VCBS repeat-containing protein [uncultured Paraglaciecola sp.]|uniref:FG-GAP repeat domain-containing protein n=1 Tax=uncultured Paraglaciecola sp. TaxID=1765024 RepID=UPI0026037464|nr:VCBS repeat-containing protein [uncultured Paraglaciecola sp.]
MFTYVRDWLVLSGFFLFSFSTQAKYTEIFNQYEIELEFNVSQAVLTANILDTPGQELVVVGVDAKQQRILAIYAFDLASNRFMQRDKLKIANGVFAFDVGEPQSNGLQHLYYLNKTKVYRYVPAHLGHKSNWQQAQQVSSIYLGDYSDTLKQMDFIQDINNDGLDDIILPHFEQLNLWLSDCCGARHYQEIAIAARIEMNQNSVSYDTQPLYFQDMDQDGKTDLMTVEQGYLNVFSQNKNMQFSLKPNQIAIEPSIYPVEWWKMKDANGQEMDQSNIQHRSVKKIDDFNGDGIPDLAVQFTKSSGVLDKSIDFEFFYGAVVEGKLEYPEQANSRVASEDTLSGIAFFDREMDGKQEVAVSSFDIGISQIVGALLSGSIDQDVLIFAMDENHQFGSKPMVTQEVEITFSLRSGTRGQPLVKMLDINGDKVKDIVYSDGDNVLRTLLATPNQNRLYAKGSLRQKLPLPKNPFNAATEDINGDGKSDLVLHHGPADSPKSLSKVLVLLAN